MMATPVTKKMKLDCKVSDITQCSSQAVVKGIITAVSLIKTSRKNAANKYFNANISDGMKSMKIVAFDPKLHKDVEQAMKSASSVELQNIQIKEAQCSSPTSPEYEIFMNHYSRVRPITETFYLPDNQKAIDPDAGKHLSNLIDVVSLNVGQRVIVSGKVVDVQLPVAVHTREGKELQKQDCTFSDATKAIRVVLWNDDINKLVVGQSYQLNNVTLKLFDHVKVLSFSTSSSVKEIDDVGDVTEVAEEDLPPPGLQIRGEIVGIESFEQFRSCIKCKSKVEARSENIGQCTKCCCTVKLAKCTESLAAKLILQDKNGTNHTVVAFTDQVVKIVDSSSMDNIVEKLLSVGDICVFVNEKMIVTSVELL